MNVMRLGILLSRFQLSAPASPKGIEAFEERVNFTLPADYREFLGFADGGEGFIGPHSYAMLWKVEELIPFNKEYQVEEYAPGLLLFGSSGGGEAFAFDVREPSETPVVSVPFIGMDLNDIVQLAETFDGFLEYLAQQTQ